MASPNLENVLHGSFLQCLVISLPSDETGPRSLTESNAEFSAGDSANHNLVKIFNGLDEMRLPQNDVVSFRTHSAEVALGYVGRALAGEAFRPVRFSRLILINTSLCKPKNGMIRPSINARIKYGQNLFNHAL